MKQILLTGKSISKSFTLGSEIFSGIDIELRNSRVIGISGRNGSGKTTLLKILSGLSSPSKGEITLDINNTQVKRENFYRHLSFIGPYINLYEEFTGREHLKLSSELEGREFDTEEALKYMQTFNIESKKDNPINTYSSGQKQRLKYIHALLARKEILFLDEPFTNLDTEGIEAVVDIIKDYKNNDSAIVIASNDQRELELCDDIININDYQ